MVALHCLRRSILIKNVVTDESWNRSPVKLKSELVHFQGWIETLGVAFFEEPFCEGDSNDVVSLILTYKTLLIRKLWNALFIIILQNTDKKKSRRTWIKCINYRERYVRTFYNFLYLPCLFTLYILSIIDLVQGRLRKDWL